MKADEAQRRKQLGQYFTGLPVARLLAALAEAGDAASLIDPMVGTGDMLQACFDIGGMPTTAVGIDLDPIAAAGARERFKDNPNVEIEAGDAFTVRLPPHQFDLVITNPPYIRYQSRSDAVEIAPPGIEEIRSGLVKAIEDRQELPVVTRAALRKAATEYPGTSDVAVPAWILAASLVAENGVLAVVVPQAWLSRNYARAIRKLLEEAFDVVCIVEDGDASWFADAQVRTHLVVARRRPIDGSRSGRDGIVKARASRELSSSGRLVGDLGSEYEVAASLLSVSARVATQVTTGLTARVERRAGIHQNIAPPLLDAVGSAASASRTLDSYGWACGQGMRTGANDFFYVRQTPTGFETASRWIHRLVDVPAEVHHPVVRRQSDLADQFHITAAALTSHLLDLDGWAALSDRARAVAAGTDADWFDRRFRMLPKSMSDWIEEVRATPFNMRAPDRCIPDLTAVAPNQRSSPSGQPLSYWYQVPRLAPRHRPEVLMPRVCGTRPYAYRNPDRAVVDANFSTLWPAREDAIPTSAVFAMLNSTWVWAALETACTVLGGGALKVEATDLRRLPLPELDGLAIAELARLGKSLDSSSDSGVLAEIDWVVQAALGGGTVRDGVQKSVQDLAEISLRDRSR